MAEKDYKNVMHLGNPTNTIAVLNRYGFSFQKKFGQNFLIDENVVEKIVRDAGVTKDDFVLEIGPGIGTMTQILCENAREVVAVEIDDKLIPILTEDTLSWYDNVTVIHEDILKLDIVKLANERNGGKPIKVVANLPYYITTPILMKFVEESSKVKSITVTVQEEVADRLTAKAGTETYGAITAGIDVAGNAEKLMRIPRAMFYPAPNVDSAVVKITMDRDKYGDVDLKAYRAAVRCGFASRRKTLVNNLMQSFKIPRNEAEEIVVAVKGDCLVRGETLSTEDFVDLSRMLKQKGIQF